MPIQTDEATLLAAFDAVVPRGAHHAPDYLRDVVRDLRACGLPVEVLRDSVSDRRFPAGRVEGVVAVPTVPGLTGIVCAHVAWADGTDLGVGWFLVDERDPALSTATGATAAGAAAMGEAGAAAAVSFAQAAHVCAVAPAMRRVGDALRRRTDPPARSLLD